MKYQQLNDCDEIKIDWRKGFYKFACCDCSLVHIFIFRLQGNNIIMQCIRDLKATAQRRRHMHKDSNKCIGCMASHRNKNSFPICVTKTCSDFKETK